MKFIDNLEGLVTTRLAIAKEIWTLFKLEAKLARLSLYALLINVCAMIGLFITVCLSAMVLVGYLVTLATGGSILAGIIVVLLINVCLLLYILQHVPTNLQQLSFEKTRASLTYNKLRDTNDNQDLPVSPNRPSGNESVSRTKEVS